MAEFKSWFRGPPSSGWECRTRIAFGNGLFEHLGEIVASIRIKRAFVVVDAGLTERGILSKALASLRKAGVEAKGFGQVQPNVPLKNLEQGLKAAGDERWEAVIAIGGGSSIDFGKAISILLTNPGDLRDYAGWYRVPGQPLPVVAIPTTAGTGAEVTGVVVVSDPESHAKFSLLTDKVIPRVAILDPLLTISMPKQVTVACGMDALVHAIESFTNNFMNPVGSHLAGLSIEIISSNLERVVEHPEDKDGRYQMLLGSLLAGLAFKDKGLGLGHAMSYPLTGLFGIPHGIANAILLPVVTEYNSHYCLREMAEVGALLGSRSAEVQEKVRYAVKRIEELLHKLEIPTGISRWGASEKNIDDMIADTFREGRQPLLSSNPRKPDRDEVRELFRRLLT